MATHELDMKLAFLDGVLEEKVYVHHSLGYIKKGDESKDGLKQAPRVWNSTIDKYLKANNFSRYSFKHALYVKVNEDGEFSYFILYTWMTSLYRKQSIHI